MTTRSADPDRVRLAVEALAVARADARARGDQPAGLTRSAGRSDDPERPGLSASSSRTRPSGPGGRPRREDPQPLASAIGGLLDTGRRDRLATLVADAEQVLITAAVPADVPTVLDGARFTVSAGTVTSDE